MPTYRESHRTAEKLRENAAGMLELADFIEKRGVKLPDLPYISTESNYHVFLTENTYPTDEKGLLAWNNPTLNEEATAKKVKQFVAACGNVEKEFGDTELKVRKSFGTVKLTGTVNRQLVCTKKVVDKEWVPEYKVEGHYKEKVEWDCINPSLLAL